MKTPEIQKALIDAANDLRMPADLSLRVRTLARGLSRRSPVARAEPRSAPFTPEMANAVRAYRVAHPKASQIEIARVFNVNPGRVSEALRGKRT